MDIYMQIQELYDIQTRIVTHNNIKKIYDIHMQDETSIHEHDL